MENIFKATIFGAGLQPNIRRIIAAFPFVSYADIMTRSLAIEAKEVVLKKDRDASTPSKSAQVSSSQPHWKRQKHQAYSTPHSFSRPLPYMKFYLFSKLKCGMNDSRIVLKTLPNALLNAAICKGLHSTR